MTEKKAWLALAKIFDLDKPLPFVNGFFLPIIGLCHGTAYLKNLKKITTTMKDRMDARMFDHFLDNHRPYPFVWPENRRRTSRTLRATACGFLAAMCEDNQCLT